MIQKIKLLFSMCLILSMNSQVRAQVEKILSQLPEPKDFTNVPYDQRVGWGFTMEKNGTKFIMLYSATPENKYSLKNSKYEFGITIYPDKSYFIAKYNYGKSQEGALVSADGSSALTGIFYGNKSPKYSPATCKNTGLNGSIRFIAPNPNCISFIVEDSLIYIGELSNGLYKGSASLIKDQAILNGNWIISEGKKTLNYVTPKKTSNLGPNPSKINFEGKYVNPDVQTVRISYAYSSDSKFTGNATYENPCVTFTYKKSSLSITGSSSIEYYLIFIEVQNSMGKKRSNVVAAAREYVKTKMKTPSGFEDFNVSYNDSGCSSVKSKTLNSSESNFIVFTISFEHYDPERK